MADLRHKHLETQLRRHPTPEMGTPKLKRYARLVILHTETQPYKGRHCCHVGVIWLRTHDHQVSDSQLRGVELEDYSVLNFFVDTYETEITKADHEAELFDEDAKRGPGRPRNALNCYYLCQV